MTKYIDEMNDDTPVIFQLQEVVEELRRCCDCEKEEEEEEEECETCKTNNK